MISSPGRSPAAPGRLRPGVPARIVPAMQLRASHDLSDAGSPLPRWRCVAAALLVAFALGQGLAIAHAGGAHDHEGPCAACRLVGEHASAIAPSISLAQAPATVAIFAPTAPTRVVAFEPGRSHAPRAPPSA